MRYLFIFFFFQAEDGIRDKLVTGVQTCALPIYSKDHGPEGRRALHGTERGDAGRRFRPRGIAPGTAPGGCRVPSGGVLRGCGERVTPTGRGGVFPWPRHPTPSAGQITRDNHGLSRL